MEGPVKVGNLSYIIKLKCWSGYR